MTSTCDNIPQHRSKWFHTLLLLGWLAIAISLRFTNLGGKSPSSIEISTLGFSNGHSFLEVPLDRVISLKQLLLPLRFDPTTNAGDVMHHLMSESNHPPLYFVLTHLWMKLFSENGELASVWIGRSLSAILGAVSIPAMFGLAWLAFRSLLVSQIAAALMAVSPYGIYLAQEARHYSLTILWLIASLSCLVVAMRCVYHRTCLPVWIGCAWVIVNSLGIATHYFFSLSVCAEGLVIGGFWFRDLRVWLQSKSEKIHPFVSTKFPNTSKYWQRIYVVAAVSALGFLVWLPAIRGISNQELTEWIQTSFEINELWLPIPRLLAWWITMVFLLPVEGTNLAVTAISSLVLLMALLWISPALIRGVLVQMASPLPRLSIQVLGGFFIGAIAIFLTIIYALGRDLSQAARYHFVYFPAVIVLVAAALAIYWQDSLAWKQGSKRAAMFLDKVGQHSFKPLDPGTDNSLHGCPTLSGFPLGAEGQKSKKVVVVTLLMGLLGAFTVVSNYGYQKSQRADLLASHIQATSQAPVLIAMTYETHAELRALMGLGVEFNRLESQGLDTTSATDTSNSPEFLLVKRKNYGSESTPPVLTTTLTRSQRPLDLWAVNLKADTNDLEALNCHNGSRKPRINGYRYRLYHCL